MSDTLAQVLWIAREATDKASCMNYHYQGTLWERWVSTDPQGASCNIMDQTTEFKAQSSTVKPVVHFVPNLKT